MPARWTLSLVLLLTGFAAGYLVGLRTGENTESPTQTVEPVDRATPSQGNLTIAENDPVEVFMGVIAMDWWLPIAVHQCSKKF